ncbi:MAG: hemerythrin [Acidimicrobiales bacterium]|nr:hemerythrin [Acidimicrobiales bacterium]
MNDPMTILKADHREVKRLLTALADSEEGAEREQMCSEVTASLTLHMEIEEKLLYPLVAKEIGAEDAEEADIEHGLAREGLRTMGKMVAEPGFGAAAEMLKGGITHHVEEEETELLPELKQKLARADWLALGDAIASAKAAAGAPVPPPARRRSAKRTSTAKK